MPKIIFNPSEVAKSADVNYNFTNTWNGEFMDDQSILYRHLAPEARGVVGSIVAYAGLGTEVPVGWFLCNGQSISRSVNSALFTILGTRYGSADANSFNVPNLLGRIIVQVDANQGEFNTLGKVFGEKTVTLSVAQMPHHAHGVYDPGHQHWGPFATNQIIQPIVAASDGRHGFSDGATRRLSEGSGTGIGIYGEGGSQSHNNLQPGMALNYIIKA